MSLFSGFGNPSGAQQQQKPSFQMFGQPQQQQFGQMQQQQPPAAQVELPPSNLLLVLGFLMIEWVDSWIKELYDIVDAYKTDNSMCRFLVSV
jgi:hypothetical protein